MGESTVLPTIASTRITTANTSITHTGRATIPENQMGQVS